MMRNVVLFAACLVISSCFVFVQTACAEDDMVRISPESDTVTGYTGCPVEAETCTPSDVRASTIPSFWIDKHEITYEEYWSCIERKQCTKMHAFWVSSHPRTDETASLAAELSYEQAEEYCKAQGKRLPTQQEWLAAAMGNTVRKYTWGDAFEPTAAAPSLLITKKPSTTVMDYPRDQINGIYDMSGNGCEWIESTPSGEYYENTKCIDMRSRPCMGVFPAPLYQQIGVQLDEWMAARCVK